MYDKVFSIFILLSAPSLFLFAADKASFSEEQSSQDYEMMILPPHQKNKKVRFEEKILQKKEKLAARAAKRENKGPKNKNYHGNPAAAENATPVEEEGYTEILACFSALVSAKQISTSTFTECFNIVENLEFWHKNNRQISLELSKESNSVTYTEKRLSLHPETKEVAFEQKARSLFHMLHMIFTFSKENNCLTKMCQVFASGSGCLEARITKLDKWYWDTIQTKAYYDLLPKEDQEMVLPDNSSKNAIFDVIQDEFWDQYENIPSAEEDPCKRQQAIMQLLKDIESFFVYKNQRRDIEGVALDRHLIRLVLEELLQEEIQIE